MFNWFYNLFKKETVSYKEIDDFLSSPNLRGEIIHHDLYGIKSSQYYITNHNEETFEFRFVSARFKPTTLSIMKGRGFTQRILIVSCNTAKRKEYFNKLQQIVKGP